METSDKKTRLLRPDSVWVLSAADRNLGDIIVSPKQVLTFGRKTECDVVIPSQYVSRRHAEAFVENGRLFVRDLDSTHGTLVNNQPVKQCEVQEGDEIRMDVAVFVVKRMGSSGPEMETAGEADDADRTVIRSAADMMASMDQAVAKEKPDTKPEPAVAADPVPVPQPDPPPPPVEPPAAKAASDSPPEPAAQDDSGDRHRGGGNWWETKDEGPMGTRFIKAADIAQMIDREIAPVVEADRPMLIGISPSISELRIELSPGKLVVGKKADADIRLDDEFISDVHAQLIGEGERWKVVNVLSANGTFVNGNKVQSAYLKSGDVLRFGGLDIQFVNGARQGSAVRQDSGKKGRPVLVTVIAALLLVLVIAAVITFSGGQ